MSSCNEKVPVWRLLLLFVLSLSVYLYLYTNAFDGMKTSTVFRVVEGDLQAVWRDKVGSVSYYLKLMQQEDKSIHIDVSAVEAVNSTILKQETTKAPPAIQTTAAVDETTTIDYYVQKLKDKILRNETDPLLTLFTSWTENAEKYLVHNLTTSNWLSLRPFVIPVVFTNETIVAESCRAAGWDVFSISQAAAEGIPVLKYMYRDVMDVYNTSYYAYSNSDILFTDTLVKTLAALLNSTVDTAKPVMIVGKRSNVDNVTEDDASTWENITRIAKGRGKLFTGYAEDFFITSQTYPWMEMANVVIGRRAYDNWLVYNSRKMRHVVIDATETMLAVHQTTKAGNFEGHGHKNKDYNHNLLVKMYKRIKYGAGVVECVEDYTKLENNWITIKRRKVPKGCSV